MSFHNDDRLSVQFTATESNIFHFKVFITATMAM